MIPSKDYGSIALAAWRFRALADQLGNDHPATLAASGRWRALVGHLPGRHNSGPEHVAWQRASGSARGWMNRSERRMLANVPRCIHDRPWNKCEECK